MRRLGLCLLALALGFPAASQEFNLSDARIPIAELHGLARFHTGDDPRWSGPNFDDSASMDDWRRNMGICRPTPEYFRP